MPQGFRTVTTGKSKNYDVVLANFVQARNCYLAAERSGTGGKDAPDRTSVGNKAGVLGNLPAHIEIR